MMRTITIDVDIDVDDAIEAMDDDDLIRELKSRGYEVAEEDVGIDVITDEEKDLIGEYIRAIGINNENRELYEKVRK
jgi:hypothetical protein